MDEQKKLNRTFQYLDDTIRELLAVSEGKTRFTYWEVYNQYNDCINYLHTSFSNDNVIRELIEKLPSLTKPSLFNINIKGLAELGIIGILVPYFGWIIMVMLFPVGFPVLVFRILIMSKTKEKTRQATLGLESIVSKLTQQEMGIVSL